MLFISYAMFIIFGLTIVGKIVPRKSNPNIKGNYLKINGSEIIDISNLNSEDRVTLRKDTLSINHKEKKIYSFKLFGLEKMCPINLSEVQSLKVKGLSENNYYITEIKTNIIDNKTVNVIKLSHVSSDVLKTIGAEADKEITIYDNLPSLKKGMFVTLSKDNKLSTNDSIKESMIDYKVENNTYYKYDIHKLALTFKKNYHYFLMILTFAVFYQFFAFIFDKLQ